MPNITINLSDTFEEWRTKTNTIGTSAGDLSSLNTTNKTSLVAAINEVSNSDSDDLENIVEDVTPQLGGNLDLNTYDIVGTGNISTTGTINTTTFLGDFHGTINYHTTGITQNINDNSIKIATTAYVDAQVATENTLMEMNDTTLNSLLNNDILQYNSGTSVWENTPVSSLGLATDDQAAALAIALG